MAVAIEVAVAITVGVAEAEPITVDEDKMVFWEFTHTAFSDCERITMTVAVTVAVVVEEMRFACL